ncbi:tetratricopeptide repeat protein [Oscillatoriales cyanobacterium LEGE 11467]|uniref:Tetratricopeptide repeat protein n=1 Tax=Zarconia navalis LEGE 11467 TaxID=1828826 RepID=A0A928Z902_9CYAN|nr:tetratricopeptide repeat protein [Zarconia navalis]MBE9040331.1 tetratricopeptide repeat protein [Zarconia navalis LEGE 11467]
MDTNLVTIYLVILIVLLGGAAIAVVRQIFVTRRIEGRLSKLQKKVAKGDGTAKDFYELGSILLDKKLYSQAIAQLQKAIKSKDMKGDENKAIVHNALGFAYAAQEQYDIAMRQYKDALKLQPEYPTALNNLAFTYERKKLESQALEAYEKVLKYEPKNAIAKKRSASLKRRLVSSQG